MTSMAGNNSYCQADADAIFLNVSSDGDNCSLTPYQAGVLDTLAAVRLITSLLGILGASSIILSALVRCRVRKSDVHPIFMLSVADCMLAVLWIGGAVIWYRNAREYKNVWCYAITLITAILECASINLILVYAILAYIRVKRTSLDNLRTYSVPDIRWYWTALLYLAAWILPLIIIMTLFGITSHFFSFLRGTNACACWCAPNAVNILPYAIAYDKDRYNFIITQQKFVLGLLIVLVINYLVVFISLLILYTKILQRIKEINKEHCHCGTTSKQDALLKESQRKARKRIVLFIAVFLISGFFNIAVLLVYIAVLIVLFATHTPESSRKETQHDGFPPGIKSIIILLYAQSLTLPLQGFLNAVVYGWTRDDFVQKVTRSKEAAAEDDNIMVFDKADYNCSTPTLMLTGKRLTDSSIQRKRATFLPLAYMEDSLDQNHLLTSNELDPS